MFLKGIGLGLRALGPVAPALADRLALELFVRPMRPGALREPEVAGLSAHRFSLPTEHGPIAAWDWGAGPTVILAHGWNGHAGQMTAFVEPLVRAGYYVVAYDQPAHGRTPGRRTTLLQWTKTLVLLARKLGPVHAVIGHSLGATAAALALGRGAKADRAVLIAPPAEPKLFVLRLAQALGLPAARAAGMLAALEREVGPIGSYDVRKLAPAMKARLLVVHDQQDREVPFEAGRQIAAAWPGSLLEAPSGLGHNRPLRDRAVVQRVVDFVVDRPLLSRTG